MIEEIIRFGDNENLIGILSRPEHITDIKPVFIFVNAGLLHRVGPFRIYVSTARRLVKDQFMSLRMDLSGKGDSQSKNNSLSFKENTNQDIIDAMDHLEGSYTISRFVICGICTGADNAYEAAFTDKRVIGVIPIDGYAYPTPGFYLRKFSSRLGSKRSWVNLAQKMMPSKGSRDLAVTKSELTSNYRMIFPKKPAFEQSLAASVNRNVSFLVIFTGGWITYYNYKQQFSDSLKVMLSAEGIVVEYNQDTDHTFILQKDKQWLIDTIADWAKVTYP